MNDPVALVVAKAPVPGQVKTRLAADVGLVAAADLAAAALLDTLDACESAFEQCHIALAGSLANARAGSVVERRLRSWTVHPQSGDDLGARLARAHHDVAAAARAPVVQVGMDTPQATTALLKAMAARVASADCDAVLGPALDGGWWVLALRDPAYAEALRGVPMSTAVTFRATWDALHSRGARLVDTDVLVDVDTALDASAVAEAAPTTRFAAAWAALQ